LSPADIAFEILAFLFALSVHEAAHAWTADRCGDPTARLLGRVTLNPYPHIDLFGTILMPLAGIVSGLPVLGWAKPTPVDLTRLRHPRRDDILVTAAGPGSNFAIAIAAVGLLLAVRAFSSEGGAVIRSLAFSGGRFTGGFEDASLITPVALLLYRFLFINVLLGVFNLIPIPPLDGGHIMARLIPASWLPAWEQIGRFSFMILIALLYLGVPYRLFAPVLGAFHSLLGF
jgi:Zn-dependent protease